MSRLLVHLLLSFSTLLLSCNDASKAKKSLEEISKSFSVIHNAFWSTNNTHNNFYDEAIMVLEIVRDDKTVSVDTKKLEKLLDSVQMATNHELKEVNSVDEPDNEIDYKEKAVRVLNIQSTLYNRIFPAFVNILNTTSENRFERCKELLNAPMQELGTTKKEFSIADREMLAKYGFKSYKELNPN